MGYDDYYTDIPDAFGSGPEKVLVEFAGRIPAGLPVLDVGCGQGRNALYLAAAGLDVIAIDPSQAAVDTVLAAARQRGFAVEACRAGFADFAHPGPFGAVLVFGLIQILTRAEIIVLARRARSWLPPGGLLFVTAFSTDDPGLASWSASADPIGLGSFRREDGEVRTYLAPGELPGLFPGFETVHLWEGMGPEHGHGDGPTERHGMIEVVLVRQEEGDH